MGIVVCWSIYLLELSKHLFDIDILPLSINVVDITSQLSTVDKQNILNVMTLVKREKKIIMLVLWKTKSITWIPFEVIHTSEYQSVLLHFVMICIYIFFSFWSYSFQLMIRQSWFTSRETINSRIITLISWIFWVKGYNRSWRMLCIHY